MTSTRYLRFRQPLSETFIVAAFSLASFSPAAHAQVPPPDAGRVLNELERSQSPPEPQRAPELTVEQQSRPPLQSVAGSTFTLTGFQITGASVFPEQELTRIVRDYVGKQVGLTDLEHAAGQITTFYRERGYLVARAYVPAQEIQNGQVEISILEGRIGNVTVNVGGRKTRLDESRARKYVTQSAAVGDVVQDKSLERGLLLLNDLPAIDVRSTLRPGASVGTSDLIIEAEGRKLFDGSVDADTFGSRYTGTMRVGGTANFNSPLGWGDVVSLRGVTTESGGMNFGSLSYILPLNTYGTRLGVTYTYVDYKIGKDFSYLDAHGDARVASLYALHPIVRSRNLTLHGSVGLDRKWYRNEMGQETLSDKDSTVWLLGLAGESRDELWRTALNEFGINVFHGKHDLHGSPDQFVDSVTTRTQGNFTKVNFNVARLQDLWDAFSFRASLNAQFASKNLEGAEQFVLGGPFGVRAWPQGEASGDQGMVGSAELRWDRPLQWGPSNLQLLAFVDAGHIELHKDTWTGWQGTNTRLKNSYSLYGAGLGAHYTSLDNVLVRMSYAWQLNSNPGRDAFGRDSDNTDRGGHLWLQAMKWFR